jgi:hypothetical protein
MPAALLRRRHFLFKKYTKGHELFVLGHGIMFY